VFALGEEGNPVCKQAKAEGAGTSALFVESNDFFFLRESHSALTKEFNSGREPTSLQAPYLLQLAGQTELKESDR
jgi:hypothetical protein